MTELMLAPEPRRIGRVNWIGLETFCGKEIRRFLKVYTQTIIAPVITTLLFFAVFALALGGAVRMVGPTHFLDFLVPGLIMMAIAQNAFANTSSSVIIAKVQGNIVDMLMPPLAAWEVALGYAVGGVVRGLVVGLVTAAALWPFAPFQLLDPGLLLFHALAASLMLSLLGLIGGIWAEKFDHIAAVTNFLVTPLSFLSGTFYSIQSLPEPFWWLARLNPFFYMIDGFRAGIIGHADAPVAVGVVVLLATNLGLGLLAWRLLASGYKLKP